MRALIYARVSRDPKRLGRSVEQQEAECRALCEREGWKVLDVKKDNDRSASRHARREREGWREVRDLLAAGDVDVLVCWEASRNARDLAVYAELADICRRHRVLLSYSGRVLDLDDPDDAFNAGMDALLSEREAGVTRRRILRGVRSAAMEGKPAGRPGYGYRRQYDPANGDLVCQTVYEPEAVIIREMAERVLTGESANAIVSDLNRREVPTQSGTPWAVTRVKRILVNPRVAGLRVFRGEIVGDAEWPAILDRETWDQLCAIFQNPERAIHRPGPLTYIVSGIARCGVCHGKMYHHVNRGRSTYRCRAKGCVVRSRPEVDAIVTKVVLGVLERDDLDLSPSDDPAVLAARAETQELRQRLQAAADAFSSGALHIATLSRIEADLLPQIAEADRRSRVAPVSPAVAEMAGADAAKRWDEAEIAKKRAVVRSLVDVVVLRDPNRGARRFDPRTVRVTPKV